MMSREWLVRELSEACGRRRGTVAGAGRRHKTRQGDAVVWHGDGTTIRNCTSRPFGAGVTVFSTCPPSNTVEGSGYPEVVAQVARWSEQGGCEGILVYTDNGLLDPWLVSQLIIQSTLRLAPLVAVQPVYMHPYSAAKMIASLARLHGRRIHLNMVAGGFRRDLVALNDQTPHDERYDRLVEYTTIISALLQGTAPVSFSGRYYKVNNLRLKPPLPEYLRPGIFVSGSSDAGLAAAHALGATAVQYPRPAADCSPAILPGMSTGIRVGVIARDTEAEAWAAAYARFPGDRHGQLTHQLAMKVSDSAWHQQLSSSSSIGGDAQGPYWLFPFQNYKTFCPYLVGSHRRVGQELGAYMRMGHRTFILDVPPSLEELEHTAAAFTEAQVAAPS